MTKKVQPALIGAFFIFSCCLFAVAVIIFGGNKFFDEKNTVIAYFDDSLQGLGVGAPVTYRGVTIGQVKSVKIHIREVTNQDHKISVPVLITLSSGDSVVRDSTENGWKMTPNEFLQAMCKQGLRAKLKMQSLVTGKLYIDLAEYKDTPAVFKDTEGIYIEIPTLPSEMHQIARVLENVDFADMYKKIHRITNNLEKFTSDLADSLGEKEIQQLVSDASTAMQTLNCLLTQADEQLGPLLTKIDSSLTDINTLTANADHAVDTFDSHLTPVMAGLSGSLTDLNTTIELANTVLTMASKVITPNSPFYFRFTEAMRQLADMAKSVQTLSDFLYRNPDSLILGLQNSGIDDHE